MSRDAGFVVADIDTGLMSDPKVVALARRLQSADGTAAHLALYLAVVLESWAGGDRVSIETAAPAWWLAELDTPKANLAAVGLLDADGRIPEHVWLGWYEPAAGRRDASRERWRRASASARERNRVVIDDAARSHALPTVPSVPFPTGSVASEDARRPVRDKTTTDDTTCPRCGDLVQDGQANVGVVNRRGGLGHLKCPEIERELDALAHATSAGAAA